MKPRSIILTLTMLGAVALSSGCDKEVSHEKKIKVKDGETKTQETTVTETSQGTIKVEEKTVETEDGRTETETKTKEYKAP